jgi:DNA-binding transcriptional LysR family regulator
MGGGGPELRHLRAFVAVADELHFTRAAARLHVAQQALSAQVRRLEDDLGTPLLRRTTRRVELTPAGETLLAHARGILASVDSAWEQTRRAGSGEVGVLSIAYTPTVADETLPLLTAAMHERHPEVRLVTCEMWQAEMASAVEGGRFALGLARCPELHPDLRTEVIREEPIGVLLGRGHRLARQEVVRVEELAGEPLVIWPRSLSPGFHDRVVTALRAHGFTGRVVEFENLTRDVVAGDTASRIEVAACRAFSVGFQTQAAAIGEHFAWRELDPVPLVPVDMFWRGSCGPVVDRFVALAREVAAERDWLALAAH